MASMDFYHLQESYTHIIEEGFFHVPEQIIQNIKDFYIETYKQYLKNGRGKISRRLYPPKTFKLDFTGTKFEFLNDADSSVTVYLTSKGSHYHDYNHERINTMELYKQGNIYLQLNETVFRRVLYDIIEHEVMHYIQTLMKEINKEFGGGFPNKRFWRKGLDPHGHSTTGSGRTRVTHTQRPIEYYPDLLTSIRQLFQNYHEKIKRSPDYDILIDNEKAKRHFFSEFLNAVNDPNYSEGVFTISLTVDIFREFKKISAELYKKMLNIAYNAFVNGQPNFNPKQIEKDLRMIHLNNAFDRIQDNK